MWLGHSTPEARRSSERSAWTCDVHESSDRWDTSPTLGICGETTAVSQLLNGGMEAAYGHAPINEAGSQTFSSPDVRGRACRRQRAKVAEAIPVLLVTNLPTVYQLPWSFYFKEQHF